MCECCVCIHLTNRNYELNSQYLNDWDSIKLTHIAVLLKHNVLFMFYGMKSNFVSKVRGDELAMFLMALATTHFCTPRHMSSFYFNSGNFELVELVHPIAFCAGVVDVNASLSKVLLRIAFFRLIFSNLLGDFFFV